MNDVIELYQCNECESQLATEAEALACCSSTAKLVFICGDCGEAHDTEQDAENCEH